MKQAALWRLLGLLRPFWKEVALSVAAGLLAVAAGIGLVATSAYLISAAALHPSIADLQVAIVGVRFFGLSRGVFRYLDRLATHSVNFRILARLRVWLYERLEPLAPAGLIQHRAGDVLARLIGDVDTLEQFYVRAVAPPIVAVLACAGIWAWLRGYHPAIANTLLGFLILVGLLIPILVRLLSATPGRQLITAWAALQAELVESLQGMPDLLAFGRQADQTRAVGRLSAGLARAQRRLAWVNAGQSGLTTLGVHLGAWVILVLAVDLVGSGQVAGTFLALLVLGSLAAFEAVLPLPQAAQHLENSLAAAHRLFEVADQPVPVIDRAASAADAPHPAPLARPPGIEFRAITFRYAPDLPPALDHLDLVVPPGKCLALVGASGAGKSTLINLLLRFWDYSIGEIYLGSTELRALPAEWVRRQAAVMTAATTLFNTSLRENLLLANSRASGEQIEAAVRSAQIDGWIHGLPDGYATWVGERGLRVSGGERQRLALARALLKDAPLLLLDEPTAHLDPIAEAQFFHSLPELCRGRTTLLITHRLAHLGCIDEVAVLHAGRIVERGAHADLLQFNGIYRRMWQRQVSLFDGT